MVWPFGSSASPTDAASGLDPDLKKYLDQETPSTKPEPKRSRWSELQNPESIPPKSSPNFVKESKKTTASSSTDSSKPTVPPESLFQDGRYAHLWKTYTPLAATIDDKEKMKIIQDSVKDRTLRIESAADENCVFEQQAEYDCWTKGSWGDKIWMCRNETRALERCQNMQMKFLRALGYMSIPGRSADEEERIQMHADGLYQQMLKHEEAIKEAKKKGEPIPEFKPVMSKQNLARILGVKASNELEKTVDETKKERQNAEAKMTDEERRELADKISKLSPEEKALNAVEAADRKREQTELLERWTKLREKEDEERKKREESGTLTMGDRVQNWWWSKK